MCSGGKKAETWSPFHPRLRGEDAVTGWSPAQLWDPGPQQVWKKQKVIPVKHLGCEDRGKDAQRQVSTAVSGNGCNFSGQSDERRLQEVCSGLCKKRLANLRENLQMLFNSVKAVPPWRHLLLHKAFRPNGPLESPLGQRSRGIPG